MNILLTSVRYTRSGIELPVTNEILILFPRTMLDSEAWYDKSTGEGNEGQEITGKRVEKGCEDK